jgi:cell division protein FtsQ
MLTYTLYVIAFVAVGALMSFADARHNSKSISGLNISVVDFDTLKFVNEAVITGLVRSTYDSLEYRSKNSVDISLLEKKIQKLSSVANAEVYVDIDNNLSVNVEQRRPIGRIISSKYNCYLDENGNKMPLSKLYTAKVILIDGYVTKKNLNEIYTLITYIRNDEILNEQLVSIYVNKKNEYTFRTRKGNQVIEFGKAEDIKQKFDKLLIYYRKTVSDFGWKRYSKINLKFTNQVVCTKR